MFLLDTSVLTRLRSPSVVQRLEALDGDGLARASMTDLEIGFSARSADEWDRLRTALDAFRRIEVEPHHVGRARIDRLSRACRSVLTRAPDREGASSAVARA